MTDPSGPPRLNVSQRTDVRVHATLLARVQTVQLLKMREPEIAEFIRQVETDPLFLKMLFPPKANLKVIRYQPHPRSRLSGSFYEADERFLPSDAPADVVGLLNESQGVLELIRRLGQDVFETLFLKADTELSPEALAEQCSIKPEDVRRIQSFLLGFSVHSEFFDPSSRTTALGPMDAAGRRVSRLARVEVAREGEDGEVAYHFTSPHLARGRYEINYDRFQTLMDVQEFTPEEKRHMRALVRRLELINWRQSVIFRVMDMLCHTQGKYLKTQDTLKRGTITQREMARRLSVAPSTINRAIRDRSLILPWGNESLLEEMFCSRKELCLDVMDAFEAKDTEFGNKTDQELQKQIQIELDLLVPRRTINTYRRIIAQNNK
ncbi:MAG: hypothetical protein HY548_08795 [Elusimicrobia bacterium]|nr:hypothetical protein [Elusimicrobiota bacterium]